MDSAASNNSCMSTFISNLLEGGIIEVFAPQGITATVGARQVAVGNLRLLAGQCSGAVPADLTRKDGEWRAQGEP